MTDDLFKDFEKYKRSGDKEAIQEKDHKEVVIRFKFKPIMLERAIYWVVILALLSIVVFDPLGGIKFEFNRSWETVEAGGAVISDLEETETSEEETTDQEEQTTVSLSGKITMALTSIAFERDDDGDPRKMTEIKFTVDNQKEDFRPNFKVYWYDEDDLEEVKDIKRIDATFPTLMAGTFKDYKLTKFTSKYITDYHEGEELYLKLYNADTGNLITEKSKLIE